MCLKLTIYLYSPTYIKLKIKGKYTEPLSNITNKSAHAQSVLDPN